MGVASRLFRVLTTESMSALLLLSAVAITQAKNPCEGMRFDDCRIEEDMIIDRFDFNADQCEASCKLSDTCTYWRHYEYESDSQDVLPCLHMISDYRQDCFSFAGPVDGDIDSCLNTFSYTCTAYFEDVCQFNGTRLGPEQEPKPHQISSKYECQDWAIIAESNGAAYFFYDGDTEECQLFSSMEPSCRAIGGPETAPPLDQCDWAPVFEIGPQLTLEQDSLITTLDTFPREWAVEFDFLPTSFDQAAFVDRNYANVIHMTIDGNLGYNTGFRIPAVYCNSKRKILHICTDIICKNFPLPPVDQWTNIRISQEQMATENHLTSEFLNIIFIDQEEKFRTVNPTPVDYQDVKVYAADPWYSAQQGYIRNLSINVKRF